MTEDSKKTLGKVVQIDERRIHIPEDGDWISLNGRQLQLLNTEGHARHHHVINDPASKGVFTGDSFGVSYRELDTDKGEIVFPTTTPVQFDPDEAHKAVDRIMACEPQYLYLTHYSRITELERHAAQMHTDIDAYVALALRHKDDPDRAAKIQDAMDAYLSGRLVEHGFKGDRDAVWSVLSIDIVLNAQGLVAWLERLERHNG